MDSLLLERHANGTAVLIFNRPQAHNALDLTTMRRFADAVGELAGDDGLRTVVLAGAGKAAFCSGGDLADLSQHPTAADAEAMITLMGDALLALEALPVPVIAAINGYALGGGSEIALACDLRIVDAKAQLGLVHIRRGLIPGWGGGQRLLRLVGYSRALDILIRGRILKADELVALGLANEVAPEGEALAHALALADRLAGQDAAASRAIKALLRAGLSESYRTALSGERALFPPLWEGETHVKAMAAFLEKRRGG